VSDLRETIRLNTGSAVLSALLDRYGVADLISAFASVAKDHGCVPGGAQIASDLEELANRLPTYAWRTP
jgi:hypothetical protein